MNNGVFNHKDQFDIAYNKHSCYVKKCDFLSHCMKPPQRLLGCRVRNDVTSKKADYDDSRCRLLLTAAAKKLKAKDATLRCVVVAAAGWLMVRGLEWSFIQFQFVVFYHHGIARLV